MPGGPGLSEGVSGEKWAQAVARERRLAGKTPHAQVQSGYLQPRIDI